MQRILAGFDVEGAGCKADITFLSRSIVRGFDTVSARIDGQGPRLDSNQIAAHHTVIHCVNV
ncbi:hypothetical protein D3C84_1235040 [compost metagenome]